MKLLLATTNKNKIRELKQLLGGKYEISGLIINDEVEETGSTFKENSMIKAKHYYNKYKCAVIADDSGLVIKSLSGNPGINSKRYSGFGDHENNLKVLRKLGKTDKRDAYFISCITLYINDSEYYSYEGILHGQISESIKGDNGFGYDPIFYLKESGKTLAELTHLEKNAISHRAKATKQLKEKLDEITDCK